MDYYSTHNGNIIEYGMIVGGRVAVRCTVCYEALYEGTEVLVDAYDNYYCDNECLSREVIEKDYTIDVEVITL